MFLQEMRGCHHGTEISLLLQTSQCYHSNLLERSLRVILGSSKIFPNQHFQY